MDPPSNQPLAKHPDQGATVDSNEERSAVVTAAEPPMDSAALTEGAFLVYILAQLHSGQWTPSVYLSDADLAAIEAEPIGEHFSLYPFLY
jgi:hypothetical protein